MTRRRGLLYKCTVIQEELFSVSRSQLKTFAGDQPSQLISILNRFECHELPCPGNLRRLIVEVARHELQTKPLAALYYLRSGVPISHHGLWNQISISDLFVLYRSLNATHHQILSIIEEPEEMYSVSTVFGYLLTTIGNMKHKELSAFLHFITGVRFLW